MKLRQKALTIITELRAKGYKAYFCGGCVRDWLLGREPKDYDIVTNATPDTIAEIFARTVMVGAKFGVVQVLFGKASFEVATFREDGRYQDGRRPENVHFSDEKEDALRRDFTINGMFWDPESDEIIDYVGGQEDLRNRAIRTIGAAEKRFAEDYLRLLRAIRLSCQLDFRIVDKTWECMTSMAHRIQNISKERIRDELLRMLTGPQPARALTLLKESGLLREILPELEQLPRESPLYAHCLSLLEKGAPFASPVLPLAILFRCISLTPHEQQIARLCERLRLPSATIKNIVILCTQDRFQEVPQMGMAELKRFLRLPFFSDLLNLYRLECTVEKRDLSIYDFCQEKLREFGTSLNPDPLITGNDLIALGIEPGPVFKEILNFMEDQQLEGRISTREEALSVVKEHFGELILARKGE